MNRTVFASSAVVLLLVACGGSSVPVGVTDTSQQLQTRKDGGATGDGTSCSWADTALFDQVKASSPSAAVPTYKLGDEFKSIDGCNECTCAAKGIMCTVKACEPKACSQEAMLCPDGSSVGRQGPNCEFAPCPGGVACTDDAKKCSDGSYVGRTGPKCEFVCPGDPPVICDGDARICPDGKAVGRTGPDCEFHCAGDVACSADAKQCPDGSYVGRTGPKCEFVCPAASCEAISLDVSKKLQDVIARNAKCENDVDCVNVGLSADCVSQCFRAMNKGGQTEYEAARTTANGGQCKDFTSQGCKVFPPPCAAPQTPKCVDKKCQ